MSKRIALATIAAALVGAAGAAAHTTSFSSNVSFDLLFCSDCNGGKGIGPSAHDYVAAGEVSSPKAACVPGRKVKLYAVYTGLDKRGGLAPEPELLDIDRTSEHGAWSGRFTHTLEDVDHFEARLVRRNIGPQGHRHICDEASAIRFLSIP
jgi:hypothetical protein